MSVFGRHRIIKEYSSRPTRWIMRLLPFEFEVVYQPGSKMGITDYLSRSPHLEAPEEPPDETELIVALFREFNHRKNRVVLKAVLSKWEADSVGEDRVEFLLRMHEKSNGQPVKRANEKEKWQTDRSQERHRSKRNFEMPNETIKHACESISWRIQPITAFTEPSRKEKANKAVTRPVNALHSQRKVWLKSNQKLQLPNAISYSVISKTTKMNEDNSSTVSTSSVAAQKRDLEVQITNIETQLHFLKRESQYRINSVDGRILKYRQDKRTRTQIAEYEKELLVLNQARSSLDILGKETELEPTVSKRAEIVVRDVVSIQIGMDQATEETMAEKLEHVLALTEKTDITVEKWVKETNDDPELNILRQAIIDGKEANIPLNYKLFKDELTVELGLVFVANKLAVPKTLRE